MNPIRLSLLILVSGLSALHAQTNGIDQTLDIITAPTGEKLLQWQAKAGRSYFLQVSDPADHLNKWYWYPLIESGSGQSISHEIEATADKRFFRLHYTDQTATDLDNADFDGDGLSNLQEITPVIRPGMIAARTIGGGSPPPNTTQTNPLDGDTDHDGLSDKFERDNGLDPTDNGSIDPNNGPNGDPDGDGISNGSEQTLGTHPTNLDSDGDSLADSEDADPREILVNWSKASESSYVMIDLDVPSDAGDACDLNDESEVLFENGIWDGGEWISKTPPEITGIFPANPANPDDQDWPYEIQFTGWTFFNNDRNLIQVAGLHITDGPGVGTDIYCPIFWPNGQSHPSVIFETADRWTPYISHARALGVSSNGDMTVRVTPRIPSGMPQVRQIERYNAQGAAAGIMDGTDGFHPVGSYGNGQMTPSGWVVSNLSRDASVTQPAATKIGLWNSSNAAIPLPEQAEEGGYPVTATDMPNGKVAVIAGLGTEGRVFLPNATGQYQYVASLATGRLERFAGDGTAITQDGQLWRNGKLTPLRDLCKQFGELLDADWTLQTLKANKQGIYLIKALGPDGEREAKLMLSVEVEQEGYTPAKGIRFCRWLDSFTGNTLKPDCANKDRDRFRIRIPAVLPNLTKIHIKSSGLLTAVIGGQWVSKSTDGDYDVTMTEENGAMVSKWMLLVSDGDDDVDYNGIGTDNGPNDQTLLANFNSPIEVTLPEYQNAKVVFAAQKPLGDVEIQPYYLSPPGDVPPDMERFITNHLEKMKEIYRQIGVRVGYYGIVGKAVPQSWYVPAPSQTANYFTPSESNLARAAVRGFAVPGNQIRIGFVDATLMQDSGNPFDLDPKQVRGFTVQDTDGIIVSLEPNDARLILGVTAHEVGHALGLPHTSSTWHRWLMKGDGIIWNNKPPDSKHFQSGDFEIISNRQSFYVPYVPN